MESDQHSHPHADSPPPPPPPKPNLESPAPPPDYLETTDSNQSLAPSQSTDTRPHSPPLTGLSVDHLALPSPNAASEGFNPPSPENSSFKAKQSKKSNSLGDLVDSEREYIDILAGIIRKVAGAWSRTNFPPKQLDTMFRGIESIYKANRGLLTRLKEIGLTPSSPKALGDLLMRWIDDLDAPYTKYCHNYATGFDAWDPIAANTRLLPILTALSSVHPPAPALLRTTSSNLDANGSPTWTLDALFALPRARLKYYQKLYARLLKNTQPGRSDHKLLTGAVERLETLLGILAERENLVIGQEEAGQTTDTPPVVEERSSLDTQDRDWTGKPLPDVTSSKTTDEGLSVIRNSADHSVPSSSISLEFRATQDGVLSQNDAGLPSSSSTSTPLSELERRLSTDRVLDIFTMKPKSVRLQMNPPTLPFTRSIRASTNVEVHFTPRVTPDSPRVHPRGHLILLTDLCLICEHMTAEERQMTNMGADGQNFDMWLLYPPLAGKHLRVSEVPGQANAFQIQVLRKETIILHAESTADRDFLINEFRECIEAGNLLSPRAGQPAPPPVPPLKILPHSPSTHIPQSHEKRMSLSADLPSASSSHSFDQNRQYVDPSRQLAVADRTEGLSPPPASGSRSPYQRMDSVARNSYGGRMLHESNSQPQLHIPTPLGFSNQSQHSMSSVGSGPFLPPARGPSSFQYMNQHPDLTVRPVTAPDQSQYGGPSVQPNYLPRVRSSTSLHPDQLTEQYPNSARPSLDFMSTMALRNSSSAMSLRSLPPQPNGITPMPGHPDPHEHMQAMNGLTLRDDPNNHTHQSYVNQPHLRLPFPPSATFNQRTASFASSSWVPPSQEPTSPSSPIDDDPIHTGPVLSTITAQFKCKVFLQLHHGQWKSLGAAKLKLYLQQPTNVKQLVVEAESKEKTILISTIVLTDGVERVGRTGVAIELSDKGARTGIIYMIQLRNETSASGLFDSLLAGSDRAAGRPGKA